MPSSWDANKNSTQREGVPRGMDSDRSQEGILCVILRLYSPLEPFFTKEWRPSEIELVP
jgi:hypothetical protein